MRNIFLTLALCLCSIVMNAEIISLYNDNGQGGIHKSSGKTLVIDGQYYVDLTLPSYNGKPRSERHKVYRVKDNARLFYYQPQWAEKYSYVIEANNKTPYYFNMSSAWKPSLTEDPNDPCITRPVKKIVVYRQEISGAATPMKVLLVKSGGDFMLYSGDDFFGHTIQSNAIPDSNDPSWSRKYKYRSNIGGWPVFFNISNK